MSRHRRTYRRKDTDFKTLYTKNYRKYSPIFVKDDMTVDQYGALIGRLFFQKKRKVLLSSIGSSCEFLVYLISELEKRGVVKIDKIGTFMVKSNNANKGKMEIILKATRDYNSYGLKQRSEYYHFCFNKFGNDMKFVIGSQRFDFVVCQTRIKEKAVQKYMKSFVRFEEKDMNVFVRNNKDYVVEKVKEHELLKIIPKSQVLNIYVEDKARLTIVNTRILRSNTRRIKELKYLFETLFEKNNDIPVLIFATIYESLIPNRDARKIVKTLRFDQNLYYLINNKKIVMKFNQKNIISVKHHRSDWHIFHFKPDDSKLKFVEFARVFKDGNSGIVKDVNEFRCEKTLFGDVGWKPYLKQKRKRKRRVRKSKKGKNEKTQTESKIIEKKDSEKKESEIIEKKDNRKKETIENEKKEPIKKESEKKESIKKESEKETIKKESEKKETIKKESEKKETIKKESEKKENKKKETKKIEERI